VYIFDHILPANTPCSKHVEGLSDGFLLLQGQYDSGNGISNIRRMMYPGFAFLVAGNEVHIEIINLLLDEPPRLIDPFNGRCGTSMLALL
jgi:hypothetical protein